MRARFGGTEGRRGSIFRRNDNGSRIVSGMNRCRCISRQLTACFLESSCVGCLGHSRGLPPASQPSLQRIQRPRSDLDMGSQSVGSREIDQRRLESSLKSRYHWQISRFCCKKRRLAALSERVSSSSVVGSTVFQSDVPERERTTDFLWYCEYKVTGKQVAHLLANIGNERGTVSVVY